MGQKFTNAARSPLMANIAAGDTSLTVDAALADLFPVADTGASAVPTVGKDFFKVVLQDTSGNIEIVYVRTRTLGSATFSNVMRGQEGTTARAYLAGSIVGLRYTALDLAGAIDLSVNATATGKAVLNAADAAAARTAIGALGAGPNSDTTILSALTSINGGGISGLRNRLHNPAGLIQQRVNGTLSATPQYVVDRWQTFVSGGSGVSGTIASARGIANAGRSGIGVTGASWTTGSLVNRARIKSVDVIDLGGKTITVSYRVYHDFGVATNFSLTLNKANALNNFSAVTQIGATTTASCASGTFTLVSATFALGASDADNGLELVVSSASVTVSNKNVYVGDAQLEPGSVVTVFEKLPEDLELLRCLRYCYLIFPSDGGTFGVAYATSATSGALEIPFKVPMHSAPTALEQSGVAANYSLYTGGVLRVCTSVPTYNSATTTDVGRISLTVASGQTAGLAGNLLRTSATGGYLGWSADL